MELSVMLNRFFERVRCGADFFSFSTELQRNNVSYYIYFVATGNIKIVTTSDSYISLKSKRGLIKVCPEASRFLTRIAARRHFAGKTTYEQYCMDLASAGVFKWVVDLDEGTRSYWSKCNNLLFSEKIIKPAAETGKK